ncbi:plasmid pRiA4b ORF-3 family protein [Cupriavidus sp. 2TAF22]|uniref:plasmid pRiA4b ORF-3 family protein n=1 Tax=unclassified Cupriavidus TaxID=2640874 RepID=UPI003F8FC555
MTSDSRTAPSVLQLRIALRGLSPSAWRRVLIPETMTLGQFHEVIQMVMGWTNDHLHVFVIRGQRYGEAREGALQYCTAPTVLPLGAFALREHEAFFHVLRSPGSRSCSRYGMAEPRQFQARGRIPSLPQPVSPGMD